MTRPTRSSSRRRSADRLALTDANEPVHSRDMFGGLAILMIFLAVGEVVSAAGVPLPGNVTGMILLSAALLSGRLSINSVKSASDVLLDNLAFLFVPPGVGIMVHFSVIAGNWGSIAIAVVLSTVLVLLCVGWMQQLLGRSGTSAGVKSAPLDGV